MHFFIQWFHVRHFHTRAFSTLVLTRAIGKGFDWRTGSRKEEIFSEMLKWQESITCFDWHLRAWPKYPGTCTGCRAASTHFQELTDCSSSLIRPGWSKISPIHTPAWSSSASFSRHTGHAWACLDDLGLQHQVGMDVLNIAEIMDTSVQRDPIFPTCFTVLLLGVLGIQV